jgi:hypothetical protein
VVRSDFRGRVMCSGAVDGDKRGLGEWPRAVIAIGSAVIGLTYPPCLSMGCAGHTANRPPSRVRIMIY